MKKLIALLLSLTLVFSALALSACGGDGNESETSAATETEQATEGGTETGTGEATESETEQATESGTEAGTGEATESETEEAGELPTVAEFLALANETLKNVRYHGIVRADMDASMGGEKVPMLCTSVVAEMNYIYENGALAMELSETTTSAYGAMAITSVYVDGILYEISLRNKETMPQDVFLQDNNFLAVSIFDNATLTEKDGKYVLTCDTPSPAAMEEFGFPQGTDMTVRTFELVMEKNGFPVSETIDVSVFMDGMDMAEKVSATFTPLAADYVISAPADADEYENLDPTAEDVMTDLLWTMEFVPAMRATMTMEYVFGDQIHETGECLYERCSDEETKGILLYSRVSTTSYTEEQTYAGGVLYNCYTHGDYVSKQSFQLEPDEAAARLSANPMNLDNAIFAGATVTRSPGKTTLSVTEPTEELLPMLGEVPQDPACYTSFLIELVVNEDGRLESLTFNITAEMDGEPFHQTSTTLCEYPETITITAPADADEYEEME